MPGKRDHQKGAQDGPAYLCLCGGAYDLSGGALRGPGRTDAGDLRILYGSALRGRCDRKLLYRRVHLLFPGALRGGYDGPGSVVSGKIHDDSHDSDAFPSDHPAYFFRIHISADRTRTESFRAHHQQMGTACAVYRGESERDTVSCAGTGTGRTEAV